jgi:hypothetical protein
MGRNDTQGVWALPVSVVFRPIRIATSVLGRCDQSCCSVQVTNKHRGTRYHVQDRRWKDGANVILLDSRSRCVKLAQRFGIR